jgi:hypothetical protein
LIDELNAILEEIGSGSFERRFQRFVCFDTWDEDYVDGPDGEVREDTAPQARVAELADELLRNIGSPDDALAMVLCSDGHRIAHFGAEVAKRAFASHDRLILRTAFKHSQRARAGFLFGYMGQVWTSAPKRWERMAVSLMAEPSIDWRIRSALISGISERVADKAIHLAETGKLDPEMLRLLSFVGKDGARLSQSEFESALKRILRIGNVGAQNAAIELGREWASFRKLPLTNSALWQLVSKTAHHIAKISYSDRSGYSWEDLAKLYRRQYPADDGKLLKKILSAVTRPQASPMSSVVLIASAIIRETPSTAWPIVSDLLSKPAVASEMRDWLADDYKVLQDELRAPIDAFDPEAVLAWVASDPPVRAVLIASMAPKTLDQPAGALTLGLLERFGADEAVRSSLADRFWTGTIHGSMSEAYLNIRDTARRWQASAAHPNVRRWTQELIDDMSARASRDRIQEERGF